MWCSSTTAIPAWSSRVPTPSSSTRRRRPGRHPRRRRPRPSRRALARADVPLGMKTEIFRVHTGRRDTVFDITEQCADFARQASGGGDGLLHVFVPHATAGVAVIELGAGSDRDLMTVLA